MLGRVKQWLGIEGVKLELLLPEEIRADAGVVEGQVRFHSMHPQVVKSIRIYLVERYKRGRGKNKLIDEYQLGSIELDEDINIPADVPVEVDFALPFTLAKSQIDRFGDQNFVFKGVASAAKFLKGVKSEFRIVAEANVRGTALNPFDSKTIEMQDRKSVV